jgi:hypothetical protein
MFSDRFVQREYWGVAESYYVVAPDGRRKTENITGSGWESKVKGRTGIIMFDSYWTRDGELAANASGGHIDLWNGARLTINGFWNTLSTVGRSAGMHSFFPGTSFGFSDLRRSKVILFWEVK